MEKNGQQRGNQARGAEVASGPTETVLCQRNWKATRKVGLEMNVRERDYIKK